MNKTENRKKKASSMSKVWPIVIFAILVEGMLNAEDGGVVAIIAVLLILGAVGVLLWQAAAKKMVFTASKKGSMYTVERMREKGKSLFIHEEMNEDDPIRCTHARGKEKYIQQIDGFLKNGLINKEEYKHLKERYEKLTLPSDFH